jgi:GMP synthase (glutamine-hydrolysing)
MSERVEILILDFGSQYNQLIARRVREHQVFCKIVDPQISAQEIQELSPRGIILSGGPASVTDNPVQRPDPEIYTLGIPVLGICYGMQVMAQELGGEVRPSARREYGRAPLTIQDAEDLFREIPKSEIYCWMSHGDSVTKPPAGFKTLAQTEMTIAAMADRKRALFGVQFHPEVMHTEYGKEILGNFLNRICCCDGRWTMHSFAQNAVRKIQDQVGEGSVVCGLSGGVDSSVTAVLIHRAIGRRLHCIFVDNGLLRKGEADEVKRLFSQKTGLDLHKVDATKIFLEVLKGVTDPEEKRKRIGRAFIEVFDKEAKRLGPVDFLAQGTLYPDVIESQSAFGGPSVTIKTHHNVGGLPEAMKLKLVEPLRDLFKDEVRELGRELGMDREVLWRHPFPGPGLAIRILGEVTQERLDLLREADQIFINELKDKDLYSKVWQALTVLLPIRSVGVMGDARSYDEVVALRAVTSTDGMTADWAPLPYDFLARVSNRIVNEVHGVNRVVYDISSKPPSTIEWE